MRTGVPTVSLLISITIIKIITININIFITIIIIRMRFIIEDRGLQSYAKKKGFNER